MVPRILVLAGSLNFSSPASRLANAAQLVLAQRGAEVARVSPLDHPLPMVTDGPNATVVPQIAARLGDMIRHHDAVLISSPSLHDVVPPLLVNLIAWTARASAGERPAQPWRDRIVGLVAAGGVEGEAGPVADQLRRMFGRLDADVIAAQCCIGKSDLAFDEDGWLQDGQDRADLEKTCLQLYERAQAFRKTTRPA